MDRRDPDPAPVLADLIEVSILGPLEVRRSGVVVDLPGRRHAQILVDLVLARGRRVRTETLVDHLWGDAPPATATKSVHKYVSELRRDLKTGVDGALATDGAGYVLRLPGGSVDAERFEKKVADSARLPDFEAISVLEDAESLWRGAALEGFAELDWAGPTAQRLEELRLVASERRLGMLVGLDRPTDALPELEQLNITHPLREELCAQLMLACAAAGRRSDALAAYQRLRLNLGEELGIEPSARLRDLERQILEDDLPAVGTRRRPPPGSGIPAGRRVPIPVSSFVGRTVLLERLGQALAKARLVTLTGPGGSGKTRVGIEAVLRGDGRAGTEAVLRGDGRAGTEPLFVDLSAIDSPDHVISAVVRSLGLPDQRGIEPIVLLQEAFGTRPPLLVLDNCEHVRSGVTYLVSILLAGCRDLRVLATSRIPLGIPGEQIQPVPPLGLPTETDDDHGAGDTVGQAEAVELFVSRARDVYPSFELDEHNQAAVLEICRRLDGMPLAIELAAAQVPVLTPTDIAGHLDDRFRLLDEPGGARPARQSTLRATIDWSHGLLSEPERRLFERLSVFPGPFDVAAASVVGGADGIDETGVIADLASLVRQSMVVRADDVAGEARYRLLDTLRAYGRELLVSRGDYLACRDAHARHVARHSARTVRARLDDGDRWHLAITADYHNVRAALEHAVDHDPALAAQMVFRFSRYWRRTDQVVDGLRYVERLLDVDGLELEARARLLCTAAELRVEHGEAVLAEREASEAISILSGAGDEEGLVRATFAKGVALGNGGRYGPAIELMERALASWAKADPVLWGSGGLTLGRVQLAQGDHDRAVQLFEEVLAWADSNSMEFLSAKSLWLLGVAALHRGDLTAARTLNERALDAFAGLDDASAVAHVKMSLGDIARLDDDPVSARSLYGDAYEALSDIGDRRCTASVMKNLGDLERHDDAARAVVLYVQCLERRQALGDRVGAAEALEGLADVLARTERPVIAAALLGQADTIRADTGAVAPEADRDRVSQTRDHLSRQLRPDDLAEGMATGAGMTLDAAVETARTCTDVHAQSGA